MLGKLANKNLEYELSVQRVFFIAEMHGVLAGWIIQMREGSQELFERILG